MYSATDDDREAAREVATERLADLAAELLSSEGEVESLKNEVERLEEVEQILRDELVVERERIAAYAPRLGEALGKLMSIKTLILNAEQCGSPFDLITTIAAIVIEPKAKEKKA